MNTSRGKGRVFHCARSSEKVKKRCLKCGRKYKGLTALTVKPVNRDKPEPGICKYCKRDYADEYYTEEDLNGQNLTNILTMR